MSDLKYLIYKKLAMGIPVAGLIGFLIACIMQREDLCFMALLFGLLGYPFEGAVDREDNRRFFRR